MDRRKPGWYSPSVARTITLAHAPGVDAAFLYYALTHDLVKTRGIEFRRELHDVETLNQRAEMETFDITAISLPGYAFVSDRYRLMTAGACVADGRGPIVVSRRPMTVPDLSEAVVGIPGGQTTAALVLNVLCPGVRMRPVSSELIPDEVARGSVDAGLLAQAGESTPPFCRIVDLGEWWKADTGLPLPLSVTAIRKSLDAKTTGICCDVLRATIRYALDHREEALDYALPFGRGIPRSDANRFLGTYVNGFTVEMGERGEQAADLVLRLGHEKNLLPERIVPEFVG